MLTSSTGSMRNHLQDHYDEYMQGVADRRWENQLPGVRAAIIEAERAQGAGAQGQGGARRSQFSKESFLQHIINFIIADDQVRYVTTFSHLSYLLVLRSQSMSLNALNSGSCCSFYETTCKIQISPTAQRSEHLLLWPGSLGLWS